MSISFQDSINFIEDALFCAGPFALSYTDPDQKWIIREHLISIFQDFPSFKPSVGIFTHNDGTQVTLLYADGDLCVSPNTPSVSLTIWIHELYPRLAPMVYVNSSDSMYPFVDSSGATTSSYLKNWLFSKCNLSDLVRDLIKLFAYNHPFYYSSPSACMVSKVEAMDLLACTIFYDMEAITTKNEEDMKNMLALEAKLKKRGEVLMEGIFELELEKKRLNDRRKELDDECERLLDYDKKYVPMGEIDDIFECLDRKSNVLIDLKANDLAIEDLMYALDKAIEGGGVSFDVYIKQVRMLAREQFFYRAKVNKIGLGLL